MARKVVEMGIADIANEVGVSPSLVSKVLSGRLGTTRVSARTVQAIRERAEGIGYRKNSSAAALATGKQNVIAAFIHRMGVPGSGLAEQLVEGIAEELALHDQRLLLHFYENAEQFQGQCAGLHKGVTDGVIVGGLAHAELLDALKEIRDRGVPIVTIHEWELDPTFINVGCDQVEVGRIATAHLIDQGCRRIAHIYKSGARLEGYLKALAAAGLPQDPKLLFAARDYGYQAGTDAIREFTARGVSYDGLVAQSDQQAVGALNALIGAGRRVPDDIRMIGVDNSPFCEFSIVPLSSVSQMERERGRRAVQSLLELTGDRKRSAKSIWVAPTLHPRKSSL